MYDFLLTEEGDISFYENSTNNKKLRISFYTSKTNALNIKFLLERGTMLDNNEGKIFIGFDIKNKDNNKDLLSVSGNSYLMQQILIRLKTSLGELPSRKNIGSTIEVVMHKDIFDKQIQKNLEDIVVKSISEIIPNCKVEVYPGINSNNEYSNVMNVLIYSNNTLIFENEMEW